MNHKTIKSQTTQVLYRPPRDEEMYPQPKSHKDLFKTLILWLFVLVGMTSCCYKTLVAASNEQLYLAEKHSQLNKGVRK